MHTYINWCCFVRKYILTYIYTYIHTYIQYACIQGCIHAYVHTCRHDEVLISFILSWTTTEVHVLHCVQACCRVKYRFRLSWRTAAKTPTQTSESENEEKQDVDSPAPTDAEVEETAAAAKEAAKAAARAAEAVEAAAVPEKDIPGYKCTCLKDAAAVNACGKVLKNIGCHRIEWLRNWIIKIAGCRLPPGWIKRTTSMQTLKNLNTGYQLWDVIFRIYVFELWLLGMNEIWKIK